MNVSLTGIVNKYHNGHHTYIANPNISSDKRNALIIWDFDGVIPNSPPYIIGRINEYAPKENVRLPIPVTLENIRKYGATELFIREFLPRWPPTKENIAGAANLFKASRFLRLGKEIMENDYSKIEPYPGIIDLINELQYYPVKQAIVSTNSIQNIESFFKSNKIRLPYENEPQIDIIMGGASNFWTKHNALKDTIKLANVPLENVIFIADEQKDVVGGHLSGIKPIIAVTYGMCSKERLIQKKPHRLADDVPKLSQITLEEIANKTNHL